MSFADLELDYTLPEFDAVNLQCCSSAHLFEVACLRVTSSMAFYSALDGVMPC